MARTGSLTTAAEAIRAISAFGLEEEEPGSVALPGQGFEAFLSELEVGRLTGLAVAAYEGGLVELEDGQAEALYERQRDVMVWALGLEWTLLRLAAAFADARVPVVVLKGPALAHTVFTDPAWRPFGDLDLLVRTRDWRTACEVLAANGCRRRLPEPGRGFDERFGKAATHVNDLRQEIDLHRTLVLGPFGLWMDPEELFVGTATFELGGRKLRRLDDTGLFVHACIHVALGLQEPLPMMVRDVAQVAAVGRVDWFRVEDLARRWHLAPVFRHAMAMAWERLGTVWNAHAQRVLAVEPTSTERKALEAYVSPRRGRGGTALSTIRAIPGFRAKATYLRTMAFPVREFLAARDATANGGSYRRRLATPLHWWGGVVRAYTKGRSG
jgi:hypothetical protein